MSNDDKPVIVPHDIEAIDKYWEQRPQAFSAQLFERLLSGGPADDVIPLPKTPGARIAVARTVIAAGDQKIEDLEEQLRTMKRERDQSFATWVAVAINKPLFARASEPISADSKTAAENEQKKLDDSENRFFLRYLTLRNILAFLVVFGGIVGSVFAYSVNAYEKHAGALELTIKDLTDAKGRLETQIATLQGECGPQLTAKTTALEAASKQVMQLQAEAAQSSKNLAAAQAAAARSDEQANNVRKDLAVALQKITDLQTPTKK